MRESTFFVSRLRLGAVALCLLLPFVARGQTWTAFDYAARLGKGVNLGNTLEAPREGDWGFRLQEWHFETIAKAGFDHVRVPIRWNAHAQSLAPYTIDADFFERIDWVIDQAERHDMAAIVDFHHYDELHDDVAGNRDRFLGIWRQISERYAGASDSVYFELLNEPHNRLGDNEWEALIEDALPIIREHHAQRPIVVGGVRWNSVDTLPTLNLPEDDRQLIMTFHYYSPFQFTHQGAEWVDNSDPWLGTTWSGTQAQERAVTNDFNLAASVSRRRDRPVYLGEFGAYEKADMNSRAAWTQYVTEMADANDFSTAYWEFGAGFGVYDREQRRWVEPLLDAMSVTSIFDTDGNGLVEREDYLAFQSDPYDINHDAVIDGKDLLFWSKFAGDRVGDFDHNGIWQASDIDALTLATKANDADNRFDLDNDGLVTNQDRLYWIDEIVETYYGDANLDRQFDTSDFVTMFQSGKYETEQDAGWSDGDFDGDARATSTDLVFALALGGYERGPRSATAVPEPTSFGLVLCGCLSWLARFRRRERRATTGGQLC